jgi:elongation factor Ts
MQRELKAEGKPEQIWDKIIPGKVQAFHLWQLLLDQEKIRSKLHQDDSKKSWWLC